MPTSFSLHKCWVLFSWKLRHFEEALRARMAYKTPSVAQNAILGRGSLTEHAPQIVRLRSLFDTLAPRLGVREVTAKFYLNYYSYQQFQDWYKISRREILSSGSQANWLLRRYKSLYAALQAAYPQFEWQQSKFRSVVRLPVGYWKDQDNLLRALDDAERKLDIRQVFLLNYIKINEHFQGWGLVLNHTFRFEGSWLPCYCWQV